MVRPDATLESALHEWCGFAYAADSETVERMDATMSLRRLLGLRRHSRRKLDPDQLESARPWPAVGLLAEHSTLTKDKQALPTMQGLLPVSCQLFAWSAGRGSQPCEAVRADSWQLGDSSLRPVSRGRPLTDWLAEQQIVVVLEQAPAGFWIHCRVRHIATLLARGHSAVYEAEDSSQADANLVYHPKAASSWRATLERVAPRALNIGAGEDQRTGMLNLDIRPLPGVNVVCRAEKLPFRDAAVEFVMAHDLIEHFPTADVPALLDEWLRVLMPGGRFRVQTPDLHALCRRYLRGKLAPETMVKWLYGAQDHPFNFHMTLMDEAMLRNLLRQHSVVEIRRLEEQVSAKNICLVGRRAADTAVAHEPPR